jgi:hypothetical protein
MSACIAAPYGSGITVFGSIDCESGFHADDAVDADAEDDEDDDEEELGLPVPAPRCSAAEG